MPRQITVLESNKAGDGTTSIRGVFWFAMPKDAARVPLPQFVSAIIGVNGPTAITADEQAQLETGEVLEERFVITVAASTDLAQVKADLNRRYTDRAAAVTALPDTRAFYGLTFDGSAWSA
jgi:hypothetical protein